MKAIIIGAGRGSRLKAMTDNQPKCYATIGGRRIIDWTLEAFDRAGLRDKVFIGGYQIDRIRADHPGLAFEHNADWQNNNILLSLFHAEQHMAGGFVCAYSDILFKDSVVREALNHPGDIVLCVDTHWRERYVDRSQHPEGDAEKVTVSGDRVTGVHRDTPSDEAHGEYIGVAKFTPRGAALLREHYHRVQREFAGKPWREAKVFEKAYKILLFQELIEAGETFAHVDTPGGYIEVDTQQDFEYARRFWTTKHLGRK